jgi:hypothetical protein
MAALGSSRQRSDGLRIKHEEKSMKIDYLILADAAIATDGKHYLHGAGWETIATRRLPVLHPQMSAALRVRVEAGEPTRRLGVDLVGPDNGSLLAAPIYADLGPASTAQGSAAREQAICVVFNFGALNLSNPGGHAVILSENGVEIHRAGFQVDLIADELQRRGS